MTAELAIIAKLEDNASKGLQDIDANLRKLEGSSMAGSSGFSAMGAAMGAAAVAGVAAIGGLAVAAADLARDGVKAFMTYQDGINEVFTLLPGISEKAMSQMSDDVLDFTVQVGRTSDEVLPALYQSLSAGVPQDNVFDFLETAHMAALGGVTELETAVDGISSVINAYGTDVLGAAEASDLMFTAVRLGKTTFGELSANLSKVTPLASKMGIGFEDITAAMATMTAQGTPTAVATTQLARLFQELGTQGTTVNDVFQEVAGQGFLEFIEGGGSVAEALQMIEQGAKDSGVPMQNMFGSIQAGMAALQLTGSGMESFTKNLDEMKNSAGATEEAYARMNTGMARIFEVLGAMWEKFKIQIGAALAPLVEEAANALAGFADNVLPKVTGAFENLSSFIPSVISTVKELVALFTGAATGIDPFEEGLINLRELLGDLGVSAADAEKVADTMFQIADSAKQLGAAILQAAAPIAQWAQENIKLQDILVVLGGVLMSVVLPALWGIITAVAPVIAVFAALVLAVATLRMAWEQNFAGIQEFVDKLWTAVQTAFDGIKQIFEGDIKGGLETLSGAFEDAFSAIIEFAMNLGEEIYDALSGLWDAITDWVGDQDWEQIGTDIVEFITESLVAFDEYAQGVLADWYTTFINWVASVDWAQLGNDIVQFIVDSLTTFGEFAAGVLADWYTAFTDWVASVDWAQLGRDIIAFIVDALTTFNEYATGVLADWYQAFIDWVSNIDWKQLGYDIVTFILEGLYFFVVEVPAKLEEWYGAFTTWAGSVDWAGIATTIITAITTALGNFVETVKSTLDGWFSGTKAHVEGMSWADIGQAIIDGIKNFISGSTAIGDALKNMAQGAWDAVKNFWESRSPSRKMARLGQWMMEGWAQGIAQNASKPASAAVGAAGQVDTSIMAEVAKIVQDVSKGIAVAIDAVKELTNFDIDAGASKTKLEALKDVLHWAIRGFVVMFWKFYEDLKGVTNTLDRLPIIVEAVEQVTTAISDSVKAIGELDGLEIPTGLSSKLEQLKEFVTQAAWMFVDVADGMTGELADAIGHFTSAAASVFGIVEGAIESVEMLSAFDFDSAVNGFELAGKMEVFRNVVRTMVRLWTEAELTMEEELSDAIQNFTDAADAIFGVVEDAIDAINALRDYQPLNTWNATAYAGLLNIVAWTRSFVEQFNSVAGVIDAEGTAAVQNFSDAADSVLGLVEGAIGAIYALRDYQPLNTWSATAYAGLLNIVAWTRSFVEQFNSVAGVIDAEGTAAVQNFSDAADAVLSIMADAIEAINALANFEAVMFAPNMTGLDNIVQWVDLFVFKFNEIAGEISTAGTAAVQNFANAASAVLGLIEPAIAGLEAIATFESVAGLEGKVDIFAAQMKTAVSKLVTELQNLSNDLGEGVGIAESMAASAGAILGAVEPAVNALDSIAKFDAVKNLEGKMQTFTTQFKAAVKSLVDALKQINSDVGADVPTAQAIATAIGTIFGDVQTAIEHLDKIAKAKAPDVTKKMNYLMAQAKIISSTLTGSGSAGDAIDSALVQAAKSFASNVKEMVTAVQNALDEIDKLVKSDTPGSLQKILGAMETAMKNEIGPAGNIGTDIGKAFADGVTGELNKLIQDVKGKINEIITALRAGVTPAGEAGKALGSAFGNGLNSQSGAIAAQAASIGQNAAKSLAGGFNKNSNAFMEAARRAAKSAVDAAEKELQIASPSKVFARIGEQSLAGFAQPFLNPQTALAGVHGGMSKIASGAPMAGPQVRSGDKIEININVTGHSGSAREIEAAVMRALNKAGRGADARIRTR